MQQTLHRASRKALQPGATQEGAGAGADVRAQMHLLSLIRITLKAGCFCEGNTSEMSKIKEECYKNQLHRRCDVSTSQLCCSKHCAASENTQGAETDVLVWT